MTGQKEENRRNFLKTGGVVLTASIAGCQDLRGNGETEREPGGTDDEEDVKDDREGEDKREERVYPENVDEEIWEETLERVDEDPEITVEDFLQPITEDNSFTEYGEETAGIITQDSILDYDIPSHEHGLLEEIARQLNDFTERDEEIGETELNLLKTLEREIKLKGPEKDTPIDVRERFPDYGFDNRTDGITDFEKKGIIGYDGEVEELPDHVFETLQALRDKGLYEQNEVDVLRTMIRYVQEEFNHKNPRVDQLEESNLIEDILEGGEVTDSLSDDIIDSNRNGRIQATDVSTKYSATPDRYGTGFLADFLDLDPDKPTIAYILESTRDDNNDLVEHGVNHMTKKYAEDGFQTIIIKGRDDLEPFGRGPETSKDIGDDVRERADELGDEVFGLPCHYLIFGDTRGPEKTDLLGLNGLTYNDANYALVNTDLYTLELNNSVENSLEWAVMAETFDTLYDTIQMRDRIDQWYRERSDLSEEGKKSYSSYGYYQDEEVEKKEMNDIEKEMVLESNLDMIEPDRDFQREIMAENPDPEYEAGEGYRILDGIELGIIEMSEIG